MELAILKNNMRVPPKDKMISMHLASGDTIFCSANYTAFADISFARVVWMVEISVVVLTPDFVNKSDAI